MSAPKPGRYNTAGIFNRLTSQGFIREADLAWMEKRKRKLEMQLEEARETAEEVAELEMLQAMLVNKESDRYLFVACGGEAHSNAFIDNCMVCAPRWGKRVNRDKVLLELKVDELLLLRQAEGASPFTVVLQDGERKTIRALKCAGFVEMVGFYDAQAKITEKGREHLRRIMGAV